MKYIYRVSNMENYDETSPYFSLFFVKFNMDNSVKNTFDESKQLKHYFLRASDAYIYNVLSLKESSQSKRINVFSVSDLLLEDCYGKTIYNDDGELSEVDEVAIPREKILKYLGNKNSVSDGMVDMLKKEEFERFYLGYIDLEKNEMVYFNEYLRDNNEDYSVNLLLDSLKPKTKTYTNKEQ